MKKTTKAINYLKNNGIKSFIQRTKLHINYTKSKDYINLNGIYKQKGNNNCFKPKTQDLYIISKNNYQNSLIKDQIKKLNLYGYAIHYYHIEPDNNIYSNILPIVEKKQINYEDIKNIKNKTILLDGKFKIDNSNNIFDNNLKNEINDKYLNNISVIVLNYNNKKIIIKCLDSLLKYNSYGYEIIVVDNCSTDGSYELIKDKYQNSIKLIKNNLNGCSSGRNLAVKASNKEYLLFLDSDQIITDDNWLDNYLMINNNKERVIGWAAGWFNKKGFAGQIVDNFELRCMPPDQLYRTDIGYLGSGGMFISKMIFNKTDGFDENYDPTGYEDTDISLQIRNLGYELIYCPYLSLEHKAHQTTNNVLTDTRIEKNAQYFKNKWEKINKKLLQYKK